MSVQGERMNGITRTTEVRIEMPADDPDVAILDGYCSATGDTRTGIMRGLLAKWAPEQLHVATIVLRVAGRNPTIPESARSQPGVVPESDRK